jgi:predicted amidophosphoribosyltransferase
MRNREQLTSRILELIGAIEHQLEEVRELVSIALSEESSEQREFLIDESIVEEEEEEQKPAAKKLTKKEKESVILEARVRAAKWAKGLPETKRQKK